MTSFIGWITLFFEAFGNPCNKISAAAALQRRITRRLASFLTDSHVCLSRCGYQLHCDLALPHEHVQIRTDPHCCQILHWSLSAVLPKFLSVCEMDRDRENLIEEVDGRTYRLRINAWEKTPMRCWGEMWDLCFEHCQAASLQRSDINNQFLAF